MVARRPKLRLHPETDITNALYFPPHSHDAGECSIQRCASPGDLMGMKGMSPPEWVHMNTISLRPEFDSEPAVRFRA